VLSAEGMAFATPYSVSATIHRALLVGLSIRGSTLPANKKARLQAMGSGGPEIAFSSPRQKHAMGRALRSADSIEISQVSGTDRF
jgi:hypothetical protein